MAGPPEKDRYHFTPIHYLKKLTGPDGVLHVLSMAKASW